MRRKGKITPARIDRDYSHQVELPVPGYGLGTALDTMHAFCRGVSEDYRTTGIGKKRVETGRDGVRFCFAKPEEADAFHARFGGERIDRG